MMMLTVILVTKVNVFPVRETVTVHIIPLIVFSLNFNLTGSTKSNTCVPCPNNDFCSDKKTGHRCS